MIRNVFLVLVSLFCLSTSAFAAEIKIPSFDAAKHFYPVNSTWKSFLTDAQIAAINQKLVELKEPSYLIEYSAGPRSQSEAEWFRGKVLTQWKKRGFNDAEWSLVIVGHHPDTLVVSVPTMLGKNFRPVADASATTFQAKALDYLTDMSSQVASKKAAAKAEADRIKAEGEAKVAREKKERDEATARLRAVSLLTSEQDALLSWFVFNESTLHDKTRELLEEVKALDHMNLLSVLKTSKEVIHHLREIRETKERDSTSRVHFILYFLAGLCFLGVLTWVGFKVRSEKTRVQSFYSKWRELSSRVETILEARHMKSGEKKYSGRTEGKAKALLEQLYGVKKSPEKQSELQVISVELEALEQAIRGADGDLSIDLNTICNHNLFVNLLSRDQEISKLIEVQKHDPWSYSSERMSEIHETYRKIAELLQTLGRDFVVPSLGGIVWQELNRNQALAYLTVLVIMRGKIAARHHR